MCDLFEERYRAALPNLFTGTGQLYGRKVIAGHMHFSKIKLQIIASLLYKIGAHFGQYYGHLTQKVGADQKKKVFVTNPNWFWENQTEEGFGLDLFICQKMLSNPFQEEINREKDLAGHNKTASRAKCGPRATGWAALV